MRDRLEVTRSNSDENHPLASQSDLVTYVIKRKRGTLGARLLINLFCENDFWETNTYGWYFT